MANPVSAISLAIQAGFDFLSKRLEKMDVRFYLKEMKRMKRAINAAEGLIRTIESQGKGNQKEIRDGIDEFFKYNN